MSAITNSRVAVRPITEKRSLKHQGVAFLAVGSVTVLLDYLTLYLLTELLSWAYFFSAAVGFSLGSISNYFLSVRLVFTPGRHRPRNEFALFILTSIVGLLLNQVTMWLSVDRFELHYLFAKVAAISVVTVWNFLSKKTLVFSY